MDVVPTDISPILIFPLASAISFLISCIFFSSLSSNWPDSKQRSWVITLLSSFTTSLGSLPFLYDFLTSKASLQSIQSRDVLSNAICGAFQGALISDLVIGSQSYPDRLSPTMGWGHHIIYSLILPYVSYKGWAHIFCTCLSMELPTCLLAISFLWPKLRNDVFCALVFFVMRVAFHVTMLGVIASKEARREVVQGSWLPACMLLVALVMHVTWFVSSVRGIIRRHHSAKASTPQVGSSISPANLLHIRSIASASNLQTIRAVGKFTVKCREARRRLSLGRSARKSLLSGALFPAFLVDPLSSEHVASLRMAYRRAILNLTSVIEESGDVSFESFKED